MRRCSWLWLILFAVHRAAFGLGQVQYVETNASPGSFPIVSEQSAATLLVDSRDFPGVLRAAGDLQSDIARVTGVKPNIRRRASALGANAILVGTLGKSRWIDRLVKKHKIDVAKVSGQWETFLIQVVPQPVPGVDSGLVIVGSDKRGTIFGIYDLSEQMGVSPWTWWADVPVEHKTALYAKPGAFRQGPPSVKYRGIFLNDEAPDLTRWVTEKYGLATNAGPDVANYGRGFYTNVFELILRLKGNYLWPAMWNNAFNEDDPENPRLADLYGVVMGTSHQEPMMRAQKEWDRRYLKTLGTWNYAKYPDVLEKFWREGIRRNKNRESIVTIGLRGANDTPMAPGGAEANKALLEKIVDVQRKIIAEETHKDAAEVPQLWCLYKEVQDYYAEGMRVPDDVTLLWSDDNWGNLRRLPTAEERKRPGGAGIYYHFDYHGGPRSYQWINTSPISKIWDQMSLAKEYGADRIWIVNVGHFKGYEFPMEFFLNFAWDTTRWTNNNLNGFTRLWAAREFGPAHAGEIADIVNKTTQYNGRRKPELLEPGTYSLDHYNEAARVQAEWDAVRDKARQIHSNLPPEMRDAFYELVRFPAEAAAQLNEIYLTAARNAAYAAQGRPSANEMAARTRQLFSDHTNLMAFFNKTLAGGKWDHFMDQPVLGYTSWRDPPTDSLRAIKLTEVAVPEGATVSNANTQVTVKAGAVNRTNITRDSLEGFLEGEGVVSMEAEHFTKNTDAGPGRWLRINNYGRTLSGMRASAPVDVPAAVPEQDSACLEYRMYLFDTGRADVVLTAGPTLNFMPGRGLHFALSFDDGPPQIVTLVPEKYSAQNGNRDWETSVKDNARLSHTAFSLTNSGYHTLKVWMVDPGVVIEKIVVNMGGLQASYLGPPESHFNRRLTSAEDWQLMMDRLGLPAPGPFPPPAKDPTRPNHGLMDGDLAFRLHAGGHTDLLDWPIFLEFAKRHFSAGKN